jgi:hypothetical protein
MIIRRFHGGRYYVEKKEAGSLLTPLLFFEEKPFLGVMIIFGTILPWNKLPH